MSPNALNGFALVFRESSFSRGDNRERFSSQTLAQPRQRAQLGRLTQAVTYGTQNPQEICHYKIVKKFCKKNFIKKSFNYIVSIGNGHLNK
ncbi:MAG: hypothetical protein LBR11_04000, partial [Deltaproteobacteria bacterium]|nr:hypothetical protein [Deltaproteobacteria bacterium]